MAASTRSAQTRGQQRQHAPGQGRGRAAGTATDGGERQVEGRAARLGGAAHPEQDPGQRQQQRHPWPREVEHQRCSRARRGALRRACRTNASAPAIQLLAVVARLAAECGSRAAIVPVSPASDAPPLGDDEGQPGLAGQSGDRRAAEHRDGEAAQQALDGPGARDEVGVVGTDGAQLAQRRAPAPAVGIAPPPRCRRRRPRAAAPASIHHPGAGGHQPGGRRRMGGSEL